MTAQPGSSGPADLAGRLTLWPGAPAGQPALHSSRPQLLPHLAAGRPARQMPDLLAAVFSLCGQAHRWTAQRALAAALKPVDRRTGATATPITATGKGTGTGADADAAAPARTAQAHRLATLREQLLRISHDWPRSLPGAPAQAAALSTLLPGCPVWRAAPVDARDRADGGADGAADDLADDPALAAMPQWLQQAWLGQPPADWLRRYEADPMAWPAHWAARGAGPLAALLHSQRAATQALATPGPALCLLDSAAITLPMLARQMARPGFCSQPHWQGEQPDTGPWCRQADPLRRPAATAWDRLVARLVEVLRLAEPGGEAWLAHGACRLGPGDGLAWTEMARGLLVHRVQLPADAADDSAPVQAWQVLAPTEWNSHPQGTLARALRRLAPGDAAGATRLAVALDPCVPFDIATATRPGDDAGRPQNPTGAFAHA